MNRIILLGLCFGSAALSAHADALAPYPVKVAPVIPLKAQAFALTDVRLLPGAFEQAMMRDKAYLLSLEPDRLLHTFRLNVGLSSTAEPYGGWEAPKVELCGHSLGHYLTALSLMCASTGDAVLKSRVEYIVSELAKCQEASPAKGFNVGYLAAFPESFMDRVETLKPVWAPWYTLHKIMAGLLDAYQLCGNTQALEVLVKNVAWVKLRVDRLTREQMQAALDREFGGMNEVLANLYAVTGNPDHLRMAQAFDHRKVFGPLSQGEDKLDGLHANTQIPKMIGAAREYELTGDVAYKKIAEYFWERVALHRSYVIGGHSDREHFFPTNEFARHLSPETTETCNTYNMLKLTRHLFAWEPAAPLMDFYERALYNHILASQDPRTGMFVYLMSLKPGHFKTYSLSTNSFWCCVGTGMENHGKYADTIYFKGKDTLYVNLFMASELDWKDKGLKVRQETRFPEEGATRLTFLANKPVKATVKLRWPAWAREFNITINGKKVRVKSQPGTFVTLNEKWKTGDTVEIQMPMELLTEPLPGEPGTVAFLYGPIVLAAELGTEGMPSPYAVRQTEQCRVPSPTVPVLVGNSPSLVSKLQPVSGRKLAFTTQGLGRPQDVTLIPFYELHHQRYSVYFQVLNEEGWKKREADQAAIETQRRQYEARIVDAFIPGEPQAETDRHLKGDKTATGVALGRKWRDSRQGGWFSYDVKVQPDQPMTLVCTYWGSDSGNREFDILVNGRKINTQKLEKNKPGEFFDQSYPIPEIITAGKNTATIKFQGLPGKTAGGVFSVMILRP
jgi:DUF1680 family protein